MRTGGIRYSEGLPIGNYVNQVLCRPGLKQLKLHLSLLMANTSYGGEKIEILLLGATLVRIVVAPENFVALATFPADARMLLPLVVCTGISCLEGDVFANATLVFNDLKNMESFFKLFHWTLF